MNDKKTNNINLVFFGTPEFAIPVLNALKNANIAPVLVITAPDAPKGRGLEISPSPVKIWALENGIPSLEPAKLKDEEFLKEVRSYKPDIFAVASYGKLIPKELLDMPAKGTLNVHPSLLPQYRGASPIASAMLSGNKITGVSIMLVDEEMDHGPVFSAKEVEIGDNETLLELSQRLSEIGGRMLADTIPAWMNGEISPKEQDHTAATYTKKITKEDGHIDWSSNAEKIVRQIRVLNPWPGTFTFWKKNNKPSRLIILNAKVASDNKNNGRRAGEVFDEGGKMAVSCGKGALLIESVKPEGRKELDSGDFLRGNKEILGTVLE